MTAEMKNHKMNGRQRREFIYALLEEEGELSVALLADKCQVSMQTVRRDLDYLYQNNKLNKMHGKAAKYHSMFEPAFTARSAINKAEKQQIGRVAASRIGDNSTIVCDSTTTVYCFIDELKDVKNLNIFLNSFVGCQLLQEKFQKNILTGQLYFLGGEFHFSEGITLGPLMSTQLDKFYFDKAVIGAGGISLEHGLSAFSSIVGNISSMMMHHANEVVVLADHTKIDKRTLYTFSDLVNINTIVTTIDPPSATWKKYIRRHNIEWINAAS